MKSALNRTQLLAVAGGVVLLLVGGALAWFGFGAMDEKLKEAAGLAEKMGNPGLAAILADTGGVARAERETAEMRKMEKEIQEGVGLTLADWSAGTKQLSGDGEDWSKDPGKWKDRLIFIQSDLEKEASKKRVRLAPDFYLGLEAFRQKSPSPEQVPGLALHLSVAELLVRLFMKAREAPEQYPTTCEFRSLSGPEPIAPGGKDNSPAGANPKGGVLPTGIERKKFRVEFRCSPEVLYEYVRLLSRNPRKDPADTFPPALLILTQLQINNDKQTFPSRSEIAKKFAPGEPQNPGKTEEAKPAKKRLFEILAGEESVTVLAEIEFVLWRNPEPSPSPSSAGAKP